MKTIYFAWLLTLIFGGCSGSGGGDSKSSEGGSTVIVSAQVSSDVQEKLQFQPQYQLDASEIELLYSEGAINEEQKKELLALLQ